MGKGENQYDNNEQPCFRRNGDPQYSSFKRKRECSSKDSKTDETLFDATFDKKLTVDLGGSTQTYDYIKSHIQELLARSAVYENFTAEPLDPLTFDYAYDFYVEGLPNKVHMHALANLDPNSGKIVR